MCIDTENVKDGPGRGDQVKRRLFGPLLSLLAGREGRPRFCASFFMRARGFCACILPCIRRRKGRKDTEKPCYGKRVSKACLKIEEVPEFLFQRERFQGGNHKTGCRLSRVSNTENRRRIHASRSGQKDGVYDFLNKLQDRLA